MTRNVNPWVKLIAVMATFFLLAITPASGQSRPACFGYDEVKKALERDADETKRAQGIVQGGRLSIELWRTNDGSTWTLLFVDPWGRACLIAVGEFWVKHSAPAPPPPVLAVPDYDVN